MFFSVRELKMSTSTSRFIVSVALIGVLLSSASICYGITAINNIDAVLARSYDQELSSVLYECGAQFQSDDIVRVQMTMPWGYVFDSNDLFTGI